MPSVTWVVQESGSPRTPSIFDGAGAAASVGGQSVEVAEVGDREAGVLDHLDQRRAVGSVDGLAVNGDPWPCLVLPCSGRDWSRGIVSGDCAGSGGRGGLWDLGDGDR